MAEVAYKCEVVRISELRESVDELDVKSSLTIALPALHLRPGDIDGFHAIVAGFQDEHSEIAELFPVLLAV